MGVPTLPAVLSTRAPGLVAVSASEKEGRVGIPTLPTVLSPLVSQQNAQFSSSSKFHSDAFSKVFPMISSNLSPDELTLSELRTGGLTQL